MLLIGYRVRENVGLYLLQVTIQDCILHVHCSEVDSLGNLRFTLVPGPLKSILSDMQRQVNLSGYIKTSRRNATISITYQEVVSVRGMYIALDLMVALFSIPRQLVYALCYFALLPCFADAKISR